jgi:hypothetical protein
MAPGFMTSAGKSYESYLKSTIDMLYREGGKMMNIPMHSRIVGKAGRAEALRNFMKYMGYGLPRAETSQTITARNFRINLVAALGVHGRLQSAVVARKAIG